MNFLKKIQTLPLGMRKLIFWILMIALAVLLFSLWTKFGLQRVGNLQVGEEFQKIQWPDIKTELESFSEMRSKIENIKLQ